ncbi:hypothetical protein PMAYCL1PPCAC_07401, partial [Pristionchus mayeri]
IGNSRFIEPLKQLITKSSTNRHSLFLLLGADLAEIELEFLALEDVSVATSDLSGSGGDAREKFASGKLLGNVRVHSGGLLSRLVHLLSSLGELGFLLLGELDSLLAANRLGIVGLVPLTERNGIDGDDGVLHKGLRADELVVGGVVDSIDDTGLASSTLASPGEVSGVETESTVLEVSSASADKMDALSSNLGVGSGTAELELSLLVGGGAVTSGCTALVPRITGDSHVSSVTLK